MQIFPAAASPILQRNDVRATSTRDIPVRTAAQRDVNAPGHPVAELRQAEADKKLCEAIGR